MAFSENATCRIVEEPKCKNATFQVVQPPSTHARATATDATDLATRTCRLPLLAAAMLSSGSWLLASCRCALPFPPAPFLAAAPTPTLTLT